MNALQNKAIDIALSGHNLLLLGPAGTGKSFVISKIAKKLTERGKHVQVTCSTGIACSVYDRMNACTIHKFLGLTDGRYGPDDITRVISNSPRYAYVLDNINAVDCLIVDECSMVSRRTFETVRQVCMLKNEKAVFGGIQMIFCGDFCQLPPVANLLYQDCGEFCFESGLFKEVFIHKVILQENLRTQDDRLSKVIGEIFNGHVSQESEHFLKVLNRPLPHAGDSIKLFAKNDIVDDFNRSLILNLSGQLFEHNAADSGDLSELTSVTAPKTLWLKVGCPVILLQNLSDELYNGRLGKVYSLDNGPKVAFQDPNLELTVPKVKFSGKFICFVLQLCI